MPSRLTALLLLSCSLLATACKPPATDDYSDRTRISARAKGPSEPIGSPDVEGALWARAAKPMRIIYGKPGEPPLMALDCLGNAAGSAVIFSRLAPADEGAEAILALIGNGHVERLFVGAEKRADGSRFWTGSVPAHDPRLEVLTGGRQVEATVPGAGSVILNPSALPGELIAQCRALAPPPPPPAGAAPDAPPASPAGPA